MLSLFVGLFHELHNQILTMFFCMTITIRGKSSKNFDFGHRSGVLDRPGSRELRAVKIPASYDAWRPPKRRKKRFGKKLIFLGFGNQFFVIFLGFWRESTILSVKINFLVKFCSRYTYSEVSATKTCEKWICASRIWPLRALSARAQIYIYGICRVFVWGGRPSPSNIKWLRKAQNLHFCCFQIYPKITPKLH